MMRFRLLGPLEVLVGDDWRAIGAPKWRSVLAALLIHPGQIVSADTLISEVWGDEPPARAANLVSIYVLRLRRLIGDADNAVLVTRAPGYQLRVSATETDALLFEALVRDGRRAHGAGDPQAAAGLLTEALGLWHGRPLADVPPTPLVEAEAERLSELRLGAAELRITAELALGGHDQAVAELRRLLADHPLREGLWLLLMRALDSAGRRTEALEVYGQAREAISAQLGVDPGAELRQLHAELLAKDTAAPAPEAKEEKKESGMDQAEMFRNFERRVASRNKLVESLSKHVGTFDATGMDEAEVAVYGCQKLNLKAPKGQERAYLDGYLSAAKPEPTARAATAMDAGEGSWLAKQREALRSA